MTKEEEEYREGIHRLECKRRKKNVQGGGGGGGQLSDTRISSKYTLCSACLVFNIFSYLSIFFHYSDLLRGLNLRWCKVTSPNDCNMAYSLPVVAIILIRYKITHSLPDPKPTIHYRPRCKFGTKPSTPIRSQIIGCTSYWNHDVTD